MRKADSTRLFLNFFIGSILVNAVLGIWALLSGDFGETEGKVLGTSFLVSAAMLSVLVNVPAMRRRVLWPAPVVGGIAGASGFALFIVLMWTEADDDGWFKLAGSFLVVAAGATLASSLALVTVPAGLRWLRTVGDALIAMLAVTILYGLWFEPDNDWYARFVGVEGVLVAAFTLVIPVLSRFASPRREQSDGEGVPSGPPAVRFCPSCGRPVTHGSLGTGVATACSECDSTFEVTWSPKPPSSSNGLESDSESDTGSDSGSDTVPTGDAAS